MIEGFALKLTVLPEFWLLWQWLTSSHSPLQTSSTSPEPFLEHHGLGFPAAFERSVEGKKTA
jgi:hypothetical protein